MTVNSQSGPPPKSPRPPDDLIATAASALRRLHFKTGRNATKTGSKPSQNQPVPKVIVMGSSTASETTINTSTDSSNTIVTTVTATDGELTEGSLDTAEQVDYFSTENFPDGGRANAVLQPIPATPKTPATARQNTPPTCKNETKFTFDVVIESSKGNLEGTPKVIPEKQRFNFEPMDTTEPPWEEKTVEKLMEEQVELLKCEARRRNSYKQAAQNYDQLDIESDSKLYSGAKRNSDVGGVMSDSKLHSQRQKEHRRSFRRKLEVREERVERTSPKRKVERGPGSSSPENETESPKPKQRHKKSSRRQQATSGSGSKPRPTSDKFVYDQQHLAKFRTNNAGTSYAAQPPPLPDLRIDFFSESLERRRSSILDSLASAAAALEKRGSVCLNKCLREVGAQLDAVVSSGGASPINVTTNPLENPVHFGGGRKAPQATIVVQQPSVSLEQQTSTILLRNGSDFLGQQESNAAKFAAFKSQKEENMKQLLDVANNLTLEEIHDFEMRYGSPHHNRSQSVKTPGRSSGRPNYLCLPQQRSRVASMPNTGVEEEYYRLRHFSITGKGVVNRGDSLKSRRSRSNNSVASSNSSTEQLAGPTSAAGSARTSASCSLASSRESSTSAPGPSPYRVLMLGGPAVGKSSLVSQFMTSEYLHAYDTSIDDESGEKSVSVLLAGEESELTFIDFTTMDLSPDSLIRKYSDPHAYAVVYSCADRSSFDCAEKILQNLWTLDTIGTRAVILVSNKADLVRSRVVTTEEGKSMATAYDCKYIETSVGINHNVDELLVGILTQIRLKLENPERSRDLFRKRSSSKKNLRNRSPVSGSVTPVTGSAQNSPKKYRGSRTSASLKVKSLLGKVWARDSKSKSCENLHVL
ncbi:uncharacterized protein [Euwallacea similis]|uniref:uncharacterized protein isoform X1 n=1 Tax=Euwallacea similis TaxID=1736056 RepID=UPI00344D0428